LEVRKRCLELRGAFQIREAEVGIGGIEVLILSEGPGPEDVSGGPFVSREVLDAARRISSCAFPVVMDKASCASVKRGPSAPPRDARRQALVRSPREAGKPVHRAADDGPAAHGGRNRRPPVVLLGRIVLLR